MTAEVHNSVDNYFVRWSQRVGAFLAIYKLGEGEAAQLCFKLNNVDEHGLSLKYATTSVTPNVSGPTESVNEPTGYSSYYEVSYKDGSKFFKNVDLAQQGGTVGTLLMQTTSDTEEVTLPQVYDTTDNVTAKIYQPDQSLNTTDEVTFDKVTTTFLGVRDFNTRNFNATELHTPLTIDLSEFDDGALLVIRDSSTAAEVSNSTAYVKKTYNGTAVLYKVAIVDGMPVATSKKPLIYDASKDAIVEATDLVVNGKLSVLDDVSISGDLYVAGTTHSTDVEDITATSDTITLRANNNTALANGQISGIVINKYNGTDDLALATDNDGTMRVGTGTGTDTSYTKLALKDSDGQYYTYNDLVTPTEYTLLSPQPSGTLTSWTGKTTVQGYTHYATAVFTVIDKTSMIPLLGRDEESNMDDSALLMWDATNVKAKTIAAPTNNNTALVAKIDAQTGEITYEWGQAGGGTVARFATKALADAAVAIPEGQEGYIPDNSLVIVDEENGYISGEVIDNYEIWNPSTPVANRKYLTDCYVENNSQMVHCSYYRTNSYSQVTFYDDTNTAIGNTVNWANRPNLYTLKIWENNTDIGATVQTVLNSLHGYIYPNIRGHSVYCSTTGSTGTFKVVDRIEYLDDASCEITFRDETWKDVTYANFGTSVVFEVRGE